jgi:hypothetical protein
MVMNQMALKNSDQNVSQQIQNIAATRATPPFKDAYGGFWLLKRPSGAVTIVTLAGIRPSPVRELCGGAIAQYAREVTRWPYAASIKPPLASRIAARSASRGLRNS